MPVYNGERFVRRALDALLSQDYEDFELIIADNASTDATREICEKYARIDKRIQYQRSDINHGAEDNFNRVFRMARGTYFMWAAADDLWEPDYVSTLLQDLKSDSEAVLAFSSFDNIDEKDETIKTYPHLFDLPSTHAFARLRNYMLQEESLGKANLIYGLMRRDALEIAAGFKNWSKGSWGVDMLVVFRLLCLGNIVVNERLLFHKRLVLNASEIVPVAPRKGLSVLTTRLARLCCSILQRHKYFNGYLRILNTAENLTQAEKRRLRGLLRKKRAGFYQSGIWIMLVEPALRKVAGRKP